MIRVRAVIFPALVFLLAGCNFPGTESPPVASPSPSEGVLPSELPSAIPPAEASPTPPEMPILPEEAILILEPGPGSRLVGTVHVAGISDPAFEQFLAIRIVLADGAVLAQSSTTIQTELGTRGPYEADIPFTVAGEQNAFIQVFTDSPRDGGIVHLNSVGVILAEAGTASINRAIPHPEDIYVANPAPGATIRGGVVHIEGVGVASFEQTLLVSLLDAYGATLASLPVIVNAPDWGLPGTFSVDLPYAVATEQAGRVVVRDISPAFGGDTHLSSVEVTLAP